MTEKTNFIDIFTSKKEISLGLAAFGIGTIFAVVGIDLVYVALTIKPAITLPTEIHASAALIATALLGYIIGKKN